MHYASDGNTYQVAINWPPFIVLMLFFVFCVGISVLGAVESNNAYRLEKFGQTITADVNNYSIFTQKTGKTYEVQYTFTIPGDATVYSMSDETTRKDLWAELPYEEWEKSRAESGTILVTYLPEKPWINHPASAEGKMDAYLVFGLFGIVSLLFPIGLYMQYRKVKKNNGAFHKNSIFYVRQVAY